MTEPISLGHNIWQLPPCFWIDLSTSVSVLQQWLHIRSECLEKMPCCHTAVILSEHGCNPALPEKIVKTGKHMTLQLQQETQTVFRCNKKLQKLLARHKTLNNPNKKFMQCREWLFL